MRRPSDHYFLNLTAKGAALFIGIVRPHLFWRHVAADGALIHVRKLPWERDR